jgi:hypothetical protein
MNPMATTIFSWVYLFRHKRFVHGINLWQQLSNRGDKLLQPKLGCGNRLFCNQKNAGIQLYYSTHSYMMYIHKIS